MRIDNKKNNNTHRFMWKTLDGKNHEQRRKIIHNVKNWNKRGEYQATTIKILENLYTIPYIYIYI